MAGVAFTFRRLSILFRCALNYLKIRNRPNEFKNTVQNALTSFRHLSVSRVLDMKLVQYSHTMTCACCRPIVQVGFMEGDYIAEINKIYPYFPQSVIDILRYGCLEEVKKLKASRTSLIHKKRVHIEPPVSGMDKVLCVGLNYKDHCKEHKLEIPKVPMIFNKFPSCVIGEKDALKLRPNAKKVDWEVELAVVIGKEATDVCAVDAFSYIAGYSVAQDITARDWQKEKNGGQFLLGKAMDTFCPLGPCMATYDEVYDPHDLIIRCTVNNVLKQESNTRELIFTIDEIIERITSVMTLLPGDIILTGTPGGVGVYRNPPEFLKHGDVIESGIQFIGNLRVRVENYINPLNFRKNSGHVCVCLPSNRPL